MLKFAVDSVDIDATQVTNARYIGKAPKGKKADSWSKVVFQHQIRHAPITPEALCLAAQGAQPQAMDASGGMSC